MPHSISFLVCLLMLVYAKPSDKDLSDSDSAELPEQCSWSCRGKEYECIEGQCYCAIGYVPHPFQNRCVKCPGTGDKCNGLCCSHDNATLTCWQGVCKPCRDEHDNWICRDSLDNILLVSSTQIAMATALVIGIIATFVLLYKLCIATSLRPLGNRNNCDSRLSIGSLQVYVDERLRDAPPRYSRTTSSPPAVLPTTVYVNAGFIHDSSIPPPPYTPPKEEENQNAALHI